MVDLNFTLVVQLLMFLGFLWLMDRYVLRPLLKTMDARESRITEDKEQAVSDQESAEKLETEYAAALAVAHQKAHQKIAQSLREAQDRHLEKQNALRQTQQQEITQAREEAQAFIENQRASFPELSRTIASAMMARLGLGGDAS